MKQKLLLALLALFTLGGSNLFAQTWSASELTDGKYVFLNVGSGRYLGPGNSWGTQASLIECSHYNTLAKVSDGVYTIESQVSNGGTAYYFSGTYMDGAAVNVTIQDNGEGIFTMSTNDSYYGYDGSTTVLANNLTDPTSTNAQWKIMAYDDVYADASEENPVDVTYMILDSNFDRNNRNETKVEDNNWTGAWTMNASNQNLCGGTNENKCAESWRSSFTLSQAITVPNGYYKLRAQAALTEYTVTGADFPVVYATSGANTVTTPFNTMQDGEGSMDTMSEKFTSGKYWTNYTDVITVTNNSLIVGAKGTRTDTWCIWDNFQLIYMGPIDLTEFANQLAAAVAAAEATEGTIPTAAYNAIAAVVEENNKTYEDEEGYSTAITAINNAVSTYASSEIVAAYSNYKAIKNAVLAINSSIDTSAADELAEAATTANQTEAIATVRSALKDYLTNNSAENVDVTAALVTNPGFELGNVNGWTNSGAQSAAAQGNKQFDNTQGNYYAERWHADGTVDLNQTVSGLAAGVYEIGAYLYTDTKDGKLYANDINTNFSTSKWYSVQVAVDADGEITFGASCTLTSSTWICMDGFKLTYVGGLPDVTAVTGKMNAEVAAAQTNAIKTYNTNRTTANYNAAVAAIAAAQASVDAYSVAATAVAKAKAIKENHNLASAEAAATFAQAIAGIENPYNEGTLADDEARNAGTTLGTGVSGWHGNNNAAAVVYLRNGFSLGDFEADPALHVNTWSTEGDNDGSGFSVPFYESWTPNSNSLATNTWTGSLSNLPTGLYKVSAWVRVQVKDGTTVADATGITMDVNGGTAVDVTEGTQVGETQFQLATYEAEGLVKDGNLTVNFNIAADNNISWLSFQNVKYEKVRDLTPEEQAVVPTSITLDETEVALDATTSTKTFTLTFTPENAEKAVSWESSDASVATVADGVVTAVSSGTATITVKSTLDENVSASATVTVSFPETEVPEYTNDGATRYVHHYGENIIKNGTFQYPNPFQGWKSGANGNCDANNYNIVTDGDNKYIQAKASQGAGDSHSISTGWRIEAGKTYVFGYKVKANAAGNSQYHVVSMTNTIGTETAKVSDDATPVTTSWTEVKYKFTNPAEDGYAYVQFRARWLGNSTSFDDFYLVEKTADDDEIGNVEYATAAIPTANIGTGVFQYSQDAIDAANALVQGEATVEDVEAAYEALTTLNSPAEGQLYNIVVAEESNAKNGNALIIVPGATSANNPTGYGLNVTLAPNTNLNQAVTFTKVSGNNYNISFETTEGTAYLTTGSLNGSAAGWKTQQIQATNDAEKKCAFTIVASTEDNVFYIYNPEHKDYIDYQDGGALYTDTNIDHKAFSLVETSKPSITINTSAAGWGTTILPFAVAEIPEGVKVYSCAGVNGTALNLEQVDALEANKPYIIEGAWDEKLTGDAQGTALSYTVGLLTGTYERIAAPNGSYVLQKHDDKVAFFQVDTSVAQPNVPANRAYLQVESEAKMFTFGGDATAICALDALLNGDAEIFNVSGVKQNSLQKGMNIIKMSDGTTRKVIVK